MMVDVFDSQNASTEVGLKNLRVACFPGFVHFVDHFFSSLAHTFIPCVEIFFLRVQTFLVGRDFLLWVEYVTLAGFQLIFQSCLVKNLINENSLVLVYHEVSHGGT